MPADLLKGWYVILLRPALTRRPLEAAVRRAGAIPLAVPGLRLRAAEDSELANQALQQALSAPAVIVTSPAAVHFARKLPAWMSVGETRFVAVGSSTGTALRRAGATRVDTPGRQENSEGLLDLPLWAEMPECVGLITAPGGRDLIADYMMDRGVVVRRANVYRRLPTRAGKRELRTIDSAGSPLAMLHSSGEALASVMTALPERSRLRIADAIVIPSSERLATQARQFGLSVAPAAGSAQPGAMLDALRQHAKAMAIR